MSDKKRQKKDGQDKGKRNQARRRADAAEKKGRDGSEGQRRAGPVAPRQAPKRRVATSTSAPGPAPMKAGRGKGK